MRWCWSFFTCWSVEVGEIGLLKVMTRSTFLLYQQVVHARTSVAEEPGKNLGRLMQAKAKSLFSHLGRAG